jgi:hypothetical protein
MKQIAYAVAGALLATALFLSVGWLDVPSRQACAWPASLDAVSAAPGNHRVVLENDRVRVLDVTVQPGERENLHAHCRSSVMYLMYEGVYRDFGPEGELLSEVTESPPDDQFPMTLWLDPQGPHSVHNLDARPVRLIRVELKDRT